MQGKDLVWSFKTKMEKMLEKKVDAIRVSIYVWIDKIW